jgi:hypothetical protein
MIVCARCGAQNQPTNKFCLSCGAPVQQAPATPGGQAPQQGSGYVAPAAAPAWGQPAPAAQPQHHAPQARLPTPSQARNRRPSRWLGRASAAGPAASGRVSPQAPGYGQAGSIALGSPEGLNPSSNRRPTPGQPQQYGAPPQQHAARAASAPAPSAMAHHSSPPTGAMGPESPFAPTSSPPTADEYSAQQGGQAQPPRTLRLRHLSAPFDTVAGGGR